MSVMVKVKRAYIRTGMYVYPTYNKSKVGMVKALRRGSDTQYASALMRWYGYEDWHHRESLRRATKEQIDREMRRRMRIKQQAGHALKHYKQKKIGFSLIPLLLLPGVVVKNCRCGMYPTIELPGGHPYQLADMVAAATPDTAGSKRKTFLFWRRLKQLILFPDSKWSQRILARHTFNVLAKGGEKA